eukprot:TRINITY_DN762_c0_g4_i1.p1 TRINITY_DN762_c0_g4~~TRINITY_DN762_c0_g4_i1.p1  ORF type:complete len:210 (+),score=35.38 TRINITY_DN762_c0_g4_i1:67-630(+)
MRPGYAAAVLVLCVAAAETAALARMRSVYWYIYLYRASEVTKFATWARNSGAVDGLSFCCNFGIVAADGTFSVSGKRPNTPAVAQALQAEGFPWTPWSVVTVPVLNYTNDTLWQLGAEQVTDWAVSLGLEGIILDYEPKSDLSTEHRAAFAAFLNNYSWGINSGTGPGVLKELGFGGGYIDWAYKSL